jgi:hypothetical protein
MTAVPADGQEMHHMTTSCAVPTPAERHYTDIQDNAERTMLATIYTAIDAASRQAAAALHATGAQEKPPAYEYFAAVAHQKLFLVLCGADPETFAGGDPDIAALILCNGQKISEHWTRTAAAPDSLSR